MTATVAAAAEYFQSAEGQQTAITTVLASNEWYKTGKWSGSGSQCCWVLLPGTLVCPCTDTTRRRRNAAIDGGSRMPSLQLNLNHKRQELLLGWGNSDW